MRKFGRVGAATILYYSVTTGIAVLIGLLMVNLIVQCGTAAIGAADIPEAGLITMVIVLHAHKLSLEGLVLLLAVDWFLDRFRTTVIIWGA